MTLLEQRQEELLHTLLKVMVGFGLVAYVPSLYACIQDQLYMLAVIDTVAYLALLVVVFYPRTSYRVKLYTTIIITLLLGTAVLYQTGTDGAGHIWLICSVVISALFGRLRVIVITIFLSQIPFLAHFPLQSFGIAAQEISAASLFAIAANLLLISITLSLITYNLIRVLRNEVETQERLLHLLQHRVKNNLQTVQSLIAFEESTDDSRERLARRVEAISAANELLIDSPHGSSILLSDIIRLVSDGHGVYIAEGEEFSVPAEKLSEVAVGTSDLLAFLQPCTPLHIVLSAAGEKKGGWGDLSIMIEIRSEGPLPTQEELRAFETDEAFPHKWSLHIDGDHRMVVTIE